MGNLCCFGSRKAETPLPPPKRASDSSDDEKAPPPEVVFQETSPLIAKLPPQPVSRAPEQPPPRPLQPPPRPDQPPPRPNQPPPRPEQPPPRPLQPPPTLSVGDKPPDCVKCGKPCPGKSMTAEGKHYHFECFVCSVCKKQVKDGYVENNGIFYCPEDYAQKFANTCSGCKKPITDTYMEAASQFYHPNCFVCSKCKEPLSEFVLQGKSLLCSNCA
eukprot:TRINITY_DN1176_c0_g1_i4.p1 TRINITY_DN1176_c0_g1~~TRINITY_DN1176_c0_g1_i4.p1  ORF type:complete len:236 (-),score=66.32 TRINITY_DN1176_c0_g1_i4:84-731(-)